MLQASLSTLIRGLFADVERVVRQTNPFVAKVTTTPTGKVEIQRYGCDDPDGEVYARLRGFDVATDEDVAVIMVGGKPFVLGTIQRSAPSAYTLSHILQLQSTLIVETAAGVDRVVVDMTGDAGNLNLSNGADLTIYSGNYASVLASIDGTTGDITTVGAITFDGDVAWFRSAPGTMRTDDDLSVGGNLTVGGHLASLKVGSTGTAIPRIRSGTTTLNFGSIPAQGSATIALGPITGLSDGDLIVATPPANWPDGLAFHVKHASTDNIAFVAVNPTGAAIDPPSGTWRYATFEF